MIIAGRFFEQHADVVLSKKIGRIKKKKYQEAPID
jgi:hypothetical protein